MSTTTSVRYDSLSATDGGDVLLLLSSSLMAETLVNDQLLMLRGEHKRIVVVVAYPSYQFSHYCRSPALLSLFDGDDCQPVKSIRIHSDALVVFE